MRVCGGFFFVCAGGRVDAVCVCKRHTPNNNTQQARAKRTDLVVDRHHADERRVVAHRRLELLEPHEAVGRDGQVGDVPAALLERAARVEHALVLRLRRDDVALALLVKAGDALDREVVALGRAAREHDLFGVGADERRDLRARALDRVLALPAIHVRAAVRVAKLLLLLLLCVFVWGGRRWWARCLSVTRFR